MTVFSPARHTTFEVERVLATSPRHAFRFWSDPVLKAKWNDCHLDWVVLDEVFEFRPGGEETKRWLQPDGSELAFRARYFDIVPERRIIWKHVMGNVLVPLLTVIALSYGYLLEGSVLTETVFTWRGLGLYITDSIFGQDLPAVMGGTIVVGFVYILINTLTDALYRFLDPRAK